MVFYVFQDENAPDDTDEEMESYFSEEPSTYTRSIADPPSGLLDMFNISHLLMLLFYDSVILPS